MSVWLPTAPCTPECCVAVAGPVVPVPVRVIRAVSALAVLVVGVALAPLVRLLGRQVRERMIMAGARALLGSLGVRATFVGAGSVQGGALLASNHISWLDILMIAAARPGRMLAKIEVRHWPAIGALAARGGTIFLDRDRLRTLPTTVAEIATGLRRGQRVVVFPEGSTWCGRASGRFRPALFQAAIDAGVPVQPITISYRQAGASGPTTTPAFVGEDGLVSSLGRVLAMRGLEAELILRTPLGTDSGLDRRALARAAQLSATGQCGHASAMPHTEPVPAA